MFLSPNYFDPEIINKPVENYYYMRFRTKASVLKCLNRENIFI